MGGCSRAITVVLGTMSEALDEAVRWSINQYAGAPDYGCSRAFTVVLGRMKDSLDKDELWSIHAPGH